MRALILLVVLAIVLLLSACGPPLATVARQQFARDQRCEPADVRVEDDRGRFHLAGCGRRADYVCADYQSGFSLDDRSRCHVTRGPIAPWHDPATVSVASPAPRLLRWY